MDVPITFRFFEKLNLYQELRKRIREDMPEWKNEGNMLSWAANPRKHKDFHTKLTVRAVFENEEIRGKIGDGVQDRCQYILNRFGNLVLRGFASWENYESMLIEDRGILFTRSGFLMGELINDLADSVWNKRLYQAVYCLLWVTFLFGVVLVIGGGVSMLWDLFTFILAHRHLLHQGLAALYCCFS